MRLACSVSSLHFVVRATAHLYDGSCAAARLCAVDAGCIVQSLVRFAGLHLYVSTEARSVLIVEIAKSDAATCTIHNPHSCIQRVCLVLYLDENPEHLGACLIVPFLVVIVQVHCASMLRMYSNFKWMYSNHAEVFCYNPM